MRAGAPLELIKVPIAKDSFRRIPKDEQVLFVSLGHLANELNVLGKLMGWCHNAPRASQAEADAHLMHTVFLAKLLAGKLNEGWEAFRRGFFGAGLSKEYHPLLEEPHGSDLDRLKRYFDRRDNAVRVVRDLTFHSSLDQIASCLEQSLSFQDELMIFLGCEYANSFYAACEVASNFAMLQAIAADDPERAIRTFLEELRDTTRLFLSVIAGWMWVFISRHLGTDLDALKAGTERINLNGLADRRRFAIPYFVTVDDGVTQAVLP